MGDFPSGQRGQTVNLLLFSFGGPNPPSPTTQKALAKASAFCNDIRSVPERVICLRHDIVLRAMIYASRMKKERILYHIATKEQYIMLAKRVYHAALAVYIIVFLSCIISHGVSRILFAFEF